MGGKVGEAECHKCYIRFPKDKMKKIEVKGGKSGSTFSMGKSGLKGARFLAGRQYYKKSWICDDCNGGGCLTFFGWFLLLGFISSLFK
jgi:hypothetical protein